MAEMSQQQQQQQEAKRRRISMAPAAPPQLEDPNNTSLSMDENGGGGGGDDVEMVVLMDDDEQQQQQKQQQQQQKENNSGDSTPVGKSGGRGKSSVGGSPKVDKVVPATPRTFAREAAAIALFERYEITGEDFVMAGAPAKRIGNAMWSLRYESSPPAKSLSQATKEAGNKGGRWCLSCKDCWCTDKLARVQITFIALLDGVEAEKEATPAAAAGGEGDSGVDELSADRQMRVIDVQNRNFRGSCITHYGNETPPIMALVRTLKEIHVPPSIFKIKSDSPDIVIFTLTATGDGGADNKPVKFFVPKEVAKTVMPALEARIADAVASKQQLIVVDELAGVAPRIFYELLLAVVGAKQHAPNPVNVAAFAALVARNRVTFGQLLKQCERHLLFCVEIPLIERLIIADKYGMVELEADVLAKLSKGGSLWAKVKSRLADMSGALKDKLLTYTYESNAKAAEEKAVAAAAANKKEAAASVAAADNDSDIASIQH